MTQEKEKTKTISITYASNNHLTNVHTLGTTDQFHIDFVPGFVCILSLETGYKEYVSADLVEKIKFS